MMWRRPAGNLVEPMVPIVREVSSEALRNANRAEHGKRIIDNFTFVGMGLDPRPPLDVPVSVDHDKWLAEAIASRWESSATGHPR